MKGRAIAAVFVAGTGWVQLWPQLWSPQKVSMVAVAGVLAFALGFVIKQDHWRFVFALWGAFLLALVSANWHAQGLLTQQLPLAEENKPFKLLIQVDSLVRLKPQSRSFRAQVLSARPDHVPETIQVNWSSQEWAGPYAAPKEQDFPLIKPGQVWQITAFLKTPHGARNRYGFDYEGYIFSQGIRATAAIRGTPILISQQPQNWSIAVVAEMWRHRLREAMLPYVQPLRWGGVIMALSIGDQASISPTDWQVFNRTGLTHLVSISGSHVTLLASMSAVFFAWLWRRFSLAGYQITEYIPAVTAASCLAFLIAGLYSLTAGWEVPARRTFIMFGIVVLSLLWRLPLSITQIIAAAMVVVLLFDPWAILASGFWLSFGAVLVLVTCAQWSGAALWLGDHSVGVRFWQQWRLAAMWQLVITISLLPPLAFLFFEISLVSPLSNAYAIPLIGLLITPLALLFALLSLTPWVGFTKVVLWLCHTLLDWNMVLTLWLSEHPLASLPAARAPAWVLGLSVVGMLVALWPKVLRFAWLGWLLVLPALFWREPALSTGEWRLHALDVGQGSALVIETKTQTLVFDTGVRRGPESDEGERTLMPYLRSLAKTKIDVLVLSHADLDHVGGTHSILQFFPVQQSYSAFDLATYLRRESRLLGMPDDNLALPLAQNLCQRGLGWQVDGVRFDFVWPSATVYGNAAGAKKDKNAEGCVLQVTGAYHRALLTGDIGIAQEKQLIELGLPKQDVVVVGHHGSRTSSGAIWVDQLQAQIAIAQVGWWSRFGHPHAEVQQRWQKAKAQFLRTDHHGAVLVHSRASALSWQAERIHQGRYWQNNSGLKAAKGNH